MMSDEKESESPGHRLSLIIGLLVALPALYVLSVGPVAAITQKTHIGDPTVRQFYIPVIWLHEHTPLRKPLEDYLKLWGVH